jgi:2,3-diketo-5-methylthio-1-phosphopentane phosphatase
MHKTVLISDFDGTISKKDFFNMVIERLLAKEDIKPWRDYLAGKITHAEALNRIFSRVRLPQNELDDFIQSIEIDENFPETLELCKRLEIPVYICSAGMDYYILKRIPRCIEKYNVTVIANKGEYSPSAGFKLTTPPENSPYYGKNIGIAKEAVVEDFKKQGYTAIFAGDGMPDIKAAASADIVFARDALLNLCGQKNIKTLKFDGFEDIINCIRKLYGLE